jgi:hypothetical protein
VANIRITNDRKVFLSTLWIFITVNYLYADVLLLLGEVAPTTPEEVEAVAALSTPEMLLVAAILFRNGDDYDRPFTSVKV